MLKIGLTGGIGSGKSTMAALLSQHGLRVIDADAIAREIVEPGQPALTELVEHFGSEIIQSDGQLDRARLAQLAFSSPEETEVLNRITHPRIAQETQRRFDEAERDGETAIIYDMPLLVENGHYHDMDLNVVVEVDREERIRRLTTSRGLAKDDVKRRIAAQATDGERRAVADVIIDNNGSVEDLRPQIKKLLNRIASYST
ncbi:dephospho-CoA kinase [Corynebacterium poyangense]|uniref:Dephospho-CoA kinase n=1 Tax=Corynebacterium poyangense TaxID=2684405 RepID=A0A7H0SNL8_9CORY|nr:dephospho-CoA kinase [Corynebacterium poyangense]MBZ8177177.1 dephospho-CoA kinase [Corynebacterium poyangense]QNQ90143.1 dephospho-CoA kinase [Corynebacterium poyangense]